MCTIKFINRPTLFHFTVMKLYLQLKLIKEPTLYNAVKHAKPMQIDKPVPPLQEAAP